VKDYTGEERRWNEHSADVALDDGVRSWSHAELREQVRTLTAALQTRGTRVLATLMNNSPAWVVADLAAAQAGVVHVPLPVFFTPQQIGHALASAGADTVLTTPDIAARWAPLPPQPVEVAGAALSWLGLPATPVAMPADTAKITYTSGTTGAPKGVCLSAQAMRRVAASLVQAMEPLQVRRHLCALPFAVLLENIAGVMAPLASGATCIVLPLEQIGLLGSSRFDAQRFAAAVVRHQPHSVILLPQMLRAWVEHLTRSGERAPDSLKLVAVGGAAVGERLLRAARDLGIPAHEGYGLSEGASVQTLNLPGADRIGTAGRPLPHARLRLADDGEIEVAGSLFAGYLGDTAAAPEWWPSGDLGHIDADGYLHIQGRKKHVLITSFGRNVSAEWIEVALHDQDAIAQAVVFGDGQPALSAVLWPMRTDATDAQLQSGVDAANATLPDYARIRHWVRAREAFSAEAGLATVNGRPRRGAILEMHASALLASDAMASN
jgi:long-subunit acyl-CoA synthetase (AMP-forming)